MSAVTRDPLALTDITAGQGSPTGTEVDACVPTTVVAPMTADAALDVAQVLKAVADPLRLRMLSYLAQSGHVEACACDLAELADVSQPTVSHHLKVLREAGILTAERRGTWVWYAIAPDYGPAVDTLLDAFSPTLPSPSTTQLGAHHDR